MSRQETIDHAAEQLIEAGRLFHQRQWVPATAGNFSARIDDNTMLITASGCHKGELTRDHLLLADLDGHPLDASRKASYETALHCQLYRFSDQIGAVFHTHSPANTLLSRHHDAIHLHGYEVLKVLPDISSHDAHYEIPVLANDQDIPRLATQVALHLQRSLNIAAYLIAGHGLYAWGGTIAEARWRVEALEFMLECELQDRRIK